MGKRAANTIKEQIALNVWSADSSENVSVVVTAFIVITVCTTTHDVLAPAVLRSTSRKHDPF